MLTVGLEGRLRRVMRSGSAHRSSLFARAIRSLTITQTRFAATLWALKALCEPDARRVGIPSAITMTGGVRRGACAVDVISAEGQVKNAFTAPFGRPDTDPTDRADILAYSTMRRSALWNAKLASRARDGLDFERTSHHGDGTEKLAWRTALVPVFVACRLARCWNGADASSMPSLSPPLQPVLAERDPQCGVGERLGAGNR